MKIMFQKGVGLVEVLVALILLAISVLGFAALQLKAIDAGSEASRQILAMTIARDLAERMRANPQAILNQKYKVGAVTLPTSYTSSTGDSEAIAKQDLGNAALQAQKNGMNLAVSNCPTVNTRQCIYVAWDDTLLSGREGTEACVKNGTYVQGSHCLFLEAY